MTADDGGRFAEAREADHLDRYLDELVGGAATPRVGLDPALGAWVRRVHTVAEAAADANASGADEARTWEELMRMQPMQSTSSMVAFPAPTGEAPVAVGVDGPRAGVKQAGWTGGRALGLVASLVLVLVAGMSAFAVYVGVPGREPEREPTPLAAGAATTPSAVAGASREAAPVVGTTAAGAIYVRPPYADCTVAPAAFEDVMETVVGDAIPFDGMPPQPEIATSQPGPNGTAQYFFDGLPDGNAVGRDVVDAAARTYALYLGCDGTPLHQAPLFTDRGLVREYWEAPSFYLQDGGADGHRLAALWSDHQGRQGIDEEHVGRLSQAYLYDFRMLPDGKVAAYLAEVWGPEMDALPAFDGNAGYVLFADEDGRWLIDEQFVGVGSDGSTG